MLKKVLSGIGIFAALSVAGSATASTAIASTTTVTSSTQVGAASRPLGLTPGQANAVKDAKSYLSFTAFSRSGLIEQLKFDGFSSKNATFAVDFIKVSWRHQAYRQAKSYLKFSAFSLSGLIDQLEFDGFTPRQARFGANRAY